MSEIGVRTHHHEPSLALIGAGPCMRLLNSCGLSIKWLDCLWLVVSHHESKLAKNHVEIREETNRKKEKAFIDLSLIYYINTLFLL